MKHLRKKEVKELNEIIKNKYNIDEFFDKKDKVISEDNVILKNNDAVFFYHDNKLIPTLKLLLERNFLPKVTVDMGAIKFVISGADVMRPGITEVGEFKKDEAIVIIDEKHKKPLSIGIALMSSEQIKAEKNGKMIKCIHYVGDNIYKI